MDSKESASAVAKEAYNLWQECHQYRLRQIGLLAAKELYTAESQIHPEPEIPKPKTYPVNFYEFIKLMLEGRYVDRRLKIYRAYAKEMIRWGHVNQLVNHPDPTKRLVRSEAEKNAEPASLSELESWMGMVTKSTFINEKDYEMAARAFLLWLSEQPSERGRNAALKRWRKESPSDAQKS